ncbi:MAG: inositol monophosphatase [Planctomycetota bacterium]
MIDVFGHGSHFCDELRLAMRAAEAAGNLLREGYGQLNTVEQKDVGDLVSQVDLDADRAIAEVLRSESDLPILSEELSASVPDADEFWIVDPLDGSSAFLLQAGEHYSSVLIALRRDGQTILGVAYFPLTEEWFYAEKGRGAWRNGKRLVVDDSSEPLGEVWVEMNQYGNASRESDFFANLRRRLRSHEGARLVTSGVPSSGVAMRIACSDHSVAAAVHDNQLKHVKQAPWDIAAPQLILEEAGGVFLTPDGERTDPFQADPIVVAKSKRLASDIIELSKTSANATVS